MDDKLKVALAVVGLMVLAVLAGAALLALGVSTVVLGYFTPVSVSGTSCDFDDSALLCNAGVMPLLGPDGSFNAKLTNGFPKTIRNVQAACLVTDSPVAPREASFSPVADSLAAGEQVRLDLPCPDASGTANYRDGEHKNGYLVVKYADAATGIEYQDTASFFITVSSITVS